MGAIGKTQTVQNNQLPQIGGPTSYGYQYRKEKLAQFIEDTGYSGEKAEQSYDLIQKYLGSFKSDRAKLDTKKIDNIIDDMVKYKGIAYRGIAITNSQLNEYKEGNIIELKNVSSWSSKKSVAEEWAEASSYNSGRRGDNKVVLVMENSTQGARAGYMGIHDEAEVLFKSTQKVQVLRKEKINGKIFIYVTENKRRKK